MIIYTLDEVQDKLIGQVGTNRDRFEYELQMDLIGKALKAKVKVQIELSQTQINIG